jgi:O-antigen/teichoic acid export membrane protein
MVADAGKRARGGAGTGAMVVGTVVAAVGAYALQFAGGRTLGPEGFAPVSAIWTLMFIITSVVHLPMEQQVTRLVATNEGIRAGRRILAGAIALAVVLGVGFVAATLTSLFEGDWVYAWQAAVLFAAVGIAAVRRGELAGSTAYRSYGYATIAQTIAMLLVGISALMLVGTAHGLIWGLALAPFANLLFRAPRSTVHRGDRPDAEVTDRPTGEAAQGRFLGAYIGASVSSQGLLAAGPLAVMLIGGNAVTVSVLFVTFTLFRAPLTLLYAMQARVLPVLVRFHVRGDMRRLSSTMIRVAAAGAVLAPVGFVAGWAVGPVVIELLYGSAFVPEAVVAAAIAAGVVLATATHLAGQVLVATAQTGRLAIAWTTGLVAAAAALVVLPGSASARVALAFLVGEALALGTVSLLGLRDAPSRATDG